MILRLRRRASVYLSLGMLLAGYALVAQATTLVTKSQMESYVMGVGITGGAVVFGAVWALLQSKTGRIEGALDRLAAGQSGMKEALDGLIGEHRAIRDGEGDICATLRMRRDDGAPSRRRRANDPEDFDGVRLRGRQ